MFAQHINISDIFFSNNTDNLNNKKLLLYLFSILKVAVQLGKKTIVGAPDFLETNVEYSYVKVAFCRESSEGTRCKINMLVEFTGSTFVDDLNHNALSIAIVCNFHTFVTLLKIVHSLFHYRVSIH